MESIREVFPKTLNVYFLSWQKWVKDSDENMIPDLTPMHIRNLMLSPRAAHDYAFNALFENDINDEKYTGSCSVTELFYNMRDYLSEDARKDLMKVYNLVYKKYWTIVFEDPSNKENSYVAYAAPAIGKRVLEIYDGKIPDIYASVDVREQLYGDGQVNNKYKNIERVINPPTTQVHAVSGCSIEGEPNPDIVKDDNLIEWSYYCINQGKILTCPFGNRNSENMCSHAVKNNASTYFRTMYYCCSEEAQMDVLTKNAQYIQGDE